MPPRTLRATPAPLGIATSTPTTRDLGMETLVIMLVMMVMFIMMTLVMMVLVMMVLVMMMLVMLCT